MYVLSPLSPDSHIALLLFFVVYSVFLLMEPQPQYKNRSKGNQRSICPSCNLSSFFNDMISYNMMLFLHYIPIMLNGIYGSFERWRRERKGGVEGADVHLGCSSGIYTDMWDLGEMAGNAWVGRWRWGRCVLVGVYFLAFRAARAASTSSSGCSGCHWAMGRRGLASMSDQCFSPAPVDLLPTKIFPMASFLPILS